MAPAEQVTMTHPEVEGSRQVARSAFDKVWEPRGWTIEEPAPAPAPKSKTTSKTRAQAQQDRSAAQAATNEGE